MTTQIKNNANTKRTSWAVLAFYFLIVFEFFYMASPFGIYFYSVYRPGLNFLNSIPGVAWLSTFFLPHIVTDTSSLFVNVHNTIGAILFLTGILMFVICAGQVYYHKLARKAEVTGGLYRLIRHPQYAAFILSSFGMLLLWPRFLVLMMFVTVCFVYYFLARIEEKECEAKFGQSYIDYKNRTGMFLPFRMDFLKAFPSLPQAGLLRVLAIAALYFMTLGAAVLAGYGVKLLAVNSLYAVYTPESAYVSVTEIEPARLEQVKDIALSDAAVRNQLLENGMQARFINYVIPSEWFISEVPLNNAPEIGRGSGHIHPDDYDRNLYKVVFTLAQLPEGSNADGKQILLTAVHKEPLVEVWLDLGRGEIAEILPAPETVKFDGVPVPVY